jgi:hypothetical protein
MTAPNAAADVLSGKKTLPLQVAKKSENWLTLS